MTDAHDQAVSLHIVSDLATPHNNCLIRALRRKEGVRVITWYAWRHSASHPWPQNLGEGEDSHYLDSWRARASLLKAAMSRDGGVFLLVGYSNVCTRALIFLFNMLGRPYMYWTDYPGEPLNPARALLREIAYRLLSQGASRFFGVGRLCVERLAQLGFPKERLADLPIVIDIPSGPVDHAAVRERYQIPPGKRLLVAASRLSHSKGYDILIEAIGLLETPVRERVALIIVGTGPEEENLKALARDSGVTSQVVFEPWLAPERYLQIIGAADIFIHPARFDAFGASIYAMAMGVPVIGSDAAGAVIERVIHGENGLIFPKGDARCLAGDIAKLVLDDAMRAELGRRARQTAESWPPSRGADILVDAARECLRHAPWGRR